MWVGGSIPVTHNYICQNPGQTALTFLQALQEHVSFGDSSLSLYPQHGQSGIDESVS
jgi:hypothetical protein